MHRLKGLVLACVFVAGCSGSANVTAPDAMASLPSGGASSGTMTVASTPSASGVAFDGAQLGRVTITNTSDAAHAFTFMVWEANNEVNQVLQAKTTETIAAGDTKVLTVGFQENCGRKYQRDVYLDIPNPASVSTLSDVQNYFFAAPGVFWQSDAGKCDNPPPPPPPPTCQDREANNYGKPLPCTFDPPPPPTDVCPNLEGNQSTVPEGYILIQGLCFPIIPPTCSQLHPPRFDVPVITQHTAGHNPFAGYVNVYNAGTWKFDIVVASTLANYNAGNFAYHDNDKSMQTIEQACDHHAQLNVTYNWVNHGTHYWGVRVRLNGVTVYVSPATDNRP